MMLLTGKTKPKLNKSAIIQRKSYSKNGFTLVELLVVIVILAIIIAVAFPNFRNTFSRLSLRSAASDCAFMIRHTRSRAVMERARYALNFDIQEKQYWITKETVSSSGIFKKIEGQLGKRVVLPTQITLESEKERIIFYPDGSIDSAVISLHGVHKVFTIVINGAVGSVHVFDSKK
ncbi:prepilin-type N-terminal cleavage/methylation domain-containing protein [Candidatus Omnitrophota bacterium]